MARTKSLVLHAIKTNHFPECTYILQKIWDRLKSGLNGIHFENVSFHECAIMRGWSINHEGVFGFTSTHDLCDAWFSRSGMEQIVKHMYENELENHIEEHPKVWNGTTLDSYIWEICKYR